jgi:hypothetical protein
MTELTTPKAIFLGLSLIAVAIASVPYSREIVRKAQAATNDVQKIAICDRSGYPCAGINVNGYIKVMNGGN